MNRVLISLKSGGPLVLDYKSDLNSFLSIVIDATERLSNLGHDFDINDMGKKFFIIVL